MAAYEALEDEFALASALIKARADAAITQERVAQAMSRTQTASRARKAERLPSTRTLARFAKAIRHAAQDQLRAGESGRLATK